MAKLARGRAALRTPTFTATLALTGVLAALAGRSALASRRLSAATVGDAVAFQGSAALVNVGRNGYRDLEIHLTGGNPPTDILAVVVNPELADHLASRPESTATVNLGLVAVGGRWFATSDTQPAISRAQVDTRRRALAEEAFDAAQGFGWFAAVVLGLGGALAFRAAPDGPDAVG